MEQKLKILLLEDTKADAELIEMELNNANLQFENVLVDTRKEFVSALRKFTPDIILADHSVASFNSMEALKIVKENGIISPFLVVTTALPEKLAASILQEGACDYVLKDNLRQLPGAIKNALAKYSFNQQETLVINPPLIEEKFYDLSLLEEMGDDDYTKEIVCIFLNETPKELNEMTAAAKSGKTDIAGKKAHKLKSSTGIVQADTLLKILKNIEEGAKSENCGNIINLVEDANEEYKKIEKALKKQFQNISS